jgi:hypothetical protein
MTSFKSVIKLGLLFQKESRVTQQFSLTKSLIVKIYGAVFLDYSFNIGLISVVVICMLTSKYPSVKYVLVFVSTFFTKQKVTHSDR